MSNKQCFIADVYEQYTTMVYQNPKLAAAAEKYGHSGLLGYCILQKAIEDKQRRSPRKGNEKLTVKNKFHMLIFRVDYRVFIIVIVFLSNFIHFKFTIFHVFFKYTYHSFQTFVEVTNLIRLIFRQMLKRCTKKK